MSASTEGGANAHANGATNGSAASQAVNPNPQRVVDSDKVWTSLITNLDYLTGLLTLDYTLKKHKSKYPLVALYTDTFPQSGLDALARRNIPVKKIPYLLPTVSKDYSNDPRFYDCWSKLTPFSLTEYDRVCQLDSDMLVLQNMDELLDTVELDPASLAGKGDRVFAASHACVCNPLGKKHYPRDWIPANCAFTTQHNTPDEAQKVGAPPTAGLAMPNGGLQVVVPCAAVYDRIVAALNDDATANYDFADQSMLSDLFPGRWVGLPYIYNALKTLRWQGVHEKIWMDDQVKNVHYILSPKPWDEKEGEHKDETHGWWWREDGARRKWEKENGVKDEYSG
ncbi:hypothetical protein KVT40_005171 [Elsinoe batatas]|uniref:Glycosyl transferase family protein n=1 Tax=Elsinoe batatas TaxID=2601811 RepID=A0A8K0L217_9PEZI|nr:hypothetical protein KVT40_005171 [Elsinoe batatas]